METIQCSQLHVKKAHDVFVSWDKGVLDIVNTTCWGIYSTVSFFYRKIVVYFNTSEFVGCIFVCLVENVALILTCSKNVHKGVKIFSDSYSIY